VKQILDKPREKAHGETEAQYKTMTMRSNGVRFLRAELFGVPIFRRLALITPQAY